MSLPLLIALCLGTILFLVICQRLIYGVYVLIAVMPLFGMYTTELWGITIKLSDWVTFISLPAFFIRFLMRPNFKLFVTPPFFPLLIFAVMNIFSCALHMPSVMDFDPQAGLNSPGIASLKVTFWCLFSMLTAWMICYAVDDEKKLRRCVLVLLFVTVGVCIYSLVGLAGFVLGIRALRWRLVDRAGGFVGLRGTFDEPNYFAHYMALVLPIALAGFILRVYRVGFLLTLMSGFILFLTNFVIFSSAGIAGSVVMIALLVFLIYHFKLLETREAVRFFLIFFFGGTVLLAVGIYYNIDFFKVVIANTLKIFDPTTPRVAGMTLASKIFVDQPLLGVGPGNWFTYFQELVPAELAGRSFAPSFNNLFLEILMDVGMVGFIPFLFIFINLFRHLWRSVKLTQDRFVQSLLVGFFAGFSALLVEYFGAFNFYRSYVWIMMGLAMATIRIARASPRVNSEAEENVS